MLQMEIRYSEDSCMGILVAVSNYKVIKSIFRIEYLFFIENILFLFYLLILFVVIFRRIKESFSMTRKLSPRTSLKAPSRVVI